MFERYTEKARWVIFRALTEAIHVKAPSIETEHLLLGIAKEDPELLPSTAGPAVTEQWARERLQAGESAPEFRPPGKELPLSKQSKRVLAYSAEEAEKLGHKHIGCEHLLLGLMREEGCAAERLLKTQGADLKQMRKEVAKRPVPRVREGGAAISYSPAAREERQVRERRERREAQEAGEPRVGFDRYTEKARRSIFFARYEASRFGAETIECEHLLLGLWREGAEMIKELMGLEPESDWSGLSERIEKHSPPKKWVETSVDMPLSDEVKRVLGFAAEEMERRRGSLVEIDDLLIGLLREEGCFAAELLRERGADVETIRKKVDEKSG